MDYPKIHVITHENWEKEENERLIRINAKPDVYEYRDEVLIKIKRKFPFSAILAGDWVEQDFAGRWCWQNISSKYHQKDHPHFCERECLNHQSEYPACPLVLATEWIQTGIDWEEKAYKKPEPHTHDGIWTTYCLAKTGYDYGNIEYFFMNEVDRDRFIVAVPTFTHGEKFGE